MKKLALFLGVCMLFGLTGSLFAEEADPRIEYQLKRMDVQYEINDSGAFRIIFDTSDDDEDERTQLVIVGSVTESIGALEVREIWSCGYRVPEGEAVSASVIKKAAMESNQYIIGAWELINDEMLIFCAKVPANLDDDTLRSIIVSVGRQADKFEQATLGTDDL
ncbi:MAG: hypothetical protein IKS83_07865 [Victivallales bacterium]|nr:hypothetical protein [Victivallales bacterium]